MRKHGIALGALALLVCATFAGCAPSDDSGPPPVVVEEPDPEMVFLNEGTAADEYFATIEQIPEPLPHGVAFPPGLPEGFIPTDGHLQEGAARNVAWFTWLCAWEAEYIDAFSGEEPERTDAAAAMLQKWPEMDFYANIVQDPTGAWISSVLDPMGLGDPSGVQGELRTMCPMFPTVPAS